MSQTQKNQTTTLQTHKSNLTYKTNIIQLLTQQNQAPLRKIKFTSFQICKKHSLFLGLITLLAHKFPKVVILTP